jgi:lipopolysaccharide export LptBFGC system permease protein LptF
MRERLGGILAVATVVVASFGSALVVSDYLAPETATLALVVVLFASTATAWIRPGE